MDIHLKYKQETRRWLGVKPSDRKDLLIFGSAIIKAVCTIENFKADKNDVYFELYDNGRRYPGWLYKRSSFLGKAVSCFKADKKCTACNKRMYCECHEVCHRCDDSCEQAKKTITMITNLGDMVSRNIDKFIHMQIDHNERESDGS